MQTKTPGSSGLCQQPQVRPLAHPRQRGKQSLVPKQQYLAFSRRPDYMPRGRPPHTHPMQCSPWVAVTITVYSLVKRAASRPLWPNPVSGDVLEQNRMAAHQVPAEPLRRASASVYQVRMLTQSSPPSTLGERCFKELLPPYTMPQIISRTGWPSQGNRVRPIWLSGLCFNGLIIVMGPTPDCEAAIHKMSLVSPESMCAVDGVPTQLGRGCHRLLCKAHP